jgi:hypothetical protein
LQHISRFQGEETLIATIPGPLAQAITFRAVGAENARRLVTTATSWCAGTIENDLQACANIIATKSSLGDDILRVLLTGGKKPWIDMW